MITFESRRLTCDQAFFFPFEGEREREGEEGEGMRCREGGYDRRLLGDR